MDDLIKQGIARIAVQGGWGTGFLVSDTGLVLTALHVIANLEKSRAAQAISRIPGKISITFGDPADQPWTPPEGTVIDVATGRYSLDDDWVLLELRTPAGTPLGAPALRLARLPAAQNGKKYEAWGFAAQHGKDGGEYDGTIADWSARKVELATPSILAGADVRGISGAPCVVDGNVVAMIVETLGTKDGAIKPVLYALPIERACQGYEALVALDDATPLPFEGEIFDNLPIGLTLERIASALGMAPPRRRDARQVARCLLSSGLGTLRRALRSRVRSPQADVILHHVGAMQLHAEAVAKLKAASERLRPALLRASFPRVWTWYLLRARPALAEKRILVIPAQAGNEEGGPAADRLVAAIAAEMRQRWGATSVIAKTALSTVRKDEREFCAIVVDQPETAVIDEVRRRLPNAHVIAAWSTDPMLREEDRKLIDEISPFFSVEEETDLMESWEAAALDLDVQL